MQDDKNSQYSSHLMENFYVKIKKSQKCENSVKGSVRDETSSY